MTRETIQLELHDQVGMLFFNRPEKRNALSPQLIEELLSSLEEFERGPARVVILSGKGKSFCAGMDLDALSALAGNSPEENVRDSQRMARMFRAIYSFPKPLIAAVNGPAIAGGCGIATLCDFTLAVPEAKFGYTEVKIGFIPAIVSVFLVRQIGEKRARDLLLTGRIFGAAEAHMLGLVNEIQPEERLLVRARELAEDLLRVSPTSLLHTKQLLRKLTEAELDREIALAVTANAAIRATPDFREGLASFLEKRHPKWTGS